MAARSGAAAKIVSAQKFALDNFLQRFVFSFEETPVWGGERYVRYYWAFS